MSFTKRLFMLAIVSVVLTLGYLFGFKKPAESAVTRELAQIDETLQNRGDGSSLNYGEPEVDGRSVNLTNVQYVDGVSETRFDIGELHAEIGISGTYSGTAQNITITPKSGNAYTIASADISGFNDKTEQFEFDALTLTAINLAGRLSKDSEANMQLGAVTISDVREQNVGQITFENITMGNAQAPAAFNLEKLELKDIEYAELMNTIESMRNGYLPLHLLPLASVENIDISGLNMLLGEDSVAGNDGKIDEADLFEFFMKNAPKELQDLVGTTDGRELADKLQELQGLPPEDQAIQGLEFLLETLKSSKN